MNAAHLYFCTWLFPPPFQWILHNIKHDRHQVAAVPFPDDEKTLSWPLWLSSRCCACMTLCCNYLEGCDWLNFTFYFMVGTRCSVTYNSTCSFTVTSKNLFSIAISLWFFKKICIMQESTLISYKRNLLDCFQCNCRSVAVTTWCENSHTTHVTHCKQQLQVGMVVKWHNVV